MLLAVMLGLGAYRLLRRGVLVRRLNAQETLGAVDLIVTDKTGTLTAEPARDRVGARGREVRSPDRSARPILVEALSRGGGRVDRDGGRAAGSFTRAPSRPAPRRAGGGARPGPT